MYDFKCTITNFFNRNKRQLTIVNDAVKFKNTVFRKGEISEYRFGICWYSYYFTFGSEYVIEIKNIKGKILKINFKTFFGQKVKYYHELYCEILDALWDNHFKDITNSYFLLQNENISFEIAGVKFNEEGIYLKGNTFIEWDEIRTKNYQTYFAVYSEKDPEKVNMTYNYLEDWNIAVFYSVLRTILREKGIENYS